MYNNTCIIMYNYIVNLFTTLLKVSGKKLCPFESFTNYKIEIKRPSIHVYPFLSNNNLYFFESKSFYSSPSSAIHSLMHLYPFSICNSQGLKEKHVLKLVRSRKLDLRHQRIHFQKLETVKL